MFSVGFPDVHVLFIGMLWIFSTYFLNRDLL